MCAKLPAQASATKRIDKELILGSAQEFDGTRILGCFPENDEFGSGCGHALRLEQASSGGSYRGLQELRRSLVGEILATRGFGSFGESPEVVDFFAATDRGLPFGWHWVALKMEPLKLSGVGERSRNGRDLVAAEMQEHEVGEPGERLRDRGQLVEIKNEGLEVSEVAERIGNSLQLIEAEIEVLKVGELAESIGDGRQPRATEIQEPEVSELGDCLGDPCQWVVAEIEASKAREPGELIGNLRQLIAEQIQPLETGEPGELIGNRRQRIEAEIEILEAGDLDDRIGDLCQSFLHSVAAEPKNVTTWEVPEKPLVGRAVKRVGVVTEIASAKAYFLECLVKRLEVIGQRYHL